MKRVCVFGVIFPANLKYFNDFLMSLKEQTYKDFEIVLLNDGVEKLDQYIKTFSDLKFVTYNVTGTPAEIREKGMKILISSNYEKIIFCDTDDYFSANRISLSLDLLEKYNVVVNDVTLVNSNKELLSKLYFSNRVNDGFVFNYKFITDKNLIGFSNTSVNKQILFEVKLNAEILAVDWYFFSSITVEKNVDIVFTNQAETFYRQHSKNAVGVGAVTEEGIVKAVRVKSLHYELLSSRNDLYKELAVGFKNLSRKLRDNDYKNKYINYVKGSNLKYPLWWEEAKTY